MDEFSFHPAAESEFLNSINYYEECEIGLGKDFAREVFYTINRIIKYPHAWPVLEGDLRRCQTKRFPYGIIYSVEPNEHIFILAVMDLHREPGYWKNRKII